MCYKLTETKASVLRWIKGRKPPDGINGLILHIKPFKKLHKYDGFPKIYVALIYMGIHEAWHWYEGPDSIWHTKISLEDWGKIEWLEESSVL